MVVTRRQSAVAEQGEHPQQSHENGVVTSPSPLAPPMTTPSRRKRRSIVSSDDQVTPSSSTLSTSSTADTQTGPESGQARGPTPSSTDDIEKSDPNGEPEPAKRKKAGEFWMRAISGLLLTAIFCAVIRGGHMWVGMAVVLMELGMFNEILRLGFTVAREGRIPLWRTTGWYFFFTLQFYLYGKIVLSHFHDQQLAFSKLPAFQYALEHHSFISFCMYCAGLVGFVLSLRPDRYHFQFTYFGRALVALLLVVIQSHFMILNTSLGLIWFVLPCWLIIANDSFGYFCGRLFGRHSLTALSPKKTWEGYIGAGIFTMITAYFLTDILSNYDSLACPRHDFNDCYFTCPPATCDPIPASFVKQTKYLFDLPAFGPLHITYRPVQVHAVSLGAFAAIIAPFGGFLASGAKRAFGIKDFGGILPGHGGVTDRVDCQLMMAVFTYVYVINFVKVGFVGSPDVGKVLSFVSELTTPEQVELLTELYLRLTKRGVDGLLANLTNATIV